MNNKKLIATAFVVLIDVLPLSFAITATSCLVILNKYKFNVSQIWLVFIIFHVLFFVTCVVFYSNFIANKTSTCVQNQQKSLSASRNNSYFLYEGDGYRTNIYYSMIDFVVSFALITVGMVTLCILREKGIVQNDLATDLMLGIMMGFTFLFGFLIVFYVVSYTANYCTIRNFKKNDSSESKLDKCCSVISNSIGSVFKHSERELKPDLYVDESLCTEMVSHKVESICSSYSCI